MNFEDLLADLEKSRITIEKEQLEINQYKEEIQKLKEQLEQKQERLDASRDKILRHQAVTDQIYILDIGTDYAHSGDIVNIVARCAECQIKILFLKLSQNAFRRFQPRVDVMDRAAQFAVFKLILYDLKARGRRAHPPRVLLQVPVPGSSHL